MGRVEPSSTRTRLRQSCSASASTSRPGHSARASVVFPGTGSADEQADVPPAFLDRQVR
ncbi:hypothetical protein [Nonomuraea sp. NPDC049625]|uniref:hypothetical protein n=1 Tax=Nonomuraea sp. NPDC049625 TaxID=3155775 RepID=UPI00342827F2